MHKAQFLLECYWGRILGPNEIFYFVDHNSRTFNIINLDEGVGRVFMLQMGPIWRINSGHCWGIRGFGD